MAPAARPKSRLEALPLRLLSFLGGGGVGCGLAFFLLMTFNPNAPHTADPAAAQEPEALPLSPYDPPAWDAQARAAAAEELILQVEKNALPRNQGAVHWDHPRGPGSLAQSFSQAAQGLAALPQLLLPHIPYSQGTYLDIGSNHPLQRSNTYFFDKCLGWRGVCVEPNTKYHPRCPRAPADVHPGEGVRVEPRGRAT